MVFPAKGKTVLPASFLHPVQAAIAISVGLFGFASVSLAQQAHPAKPIKVIVPQPAGGPVDVVARMVSESLGRRLGQPVVVDNRPGASGIIGANACKHAPADGYTFCVFLSDTVVITPSVYRKAQFGPGDFAPVAEIARIESAIVVSASLPVKNLQELASYEAANRGKLNWGHFGVGSSSHLHMTKVNSRLGTRLVDVPYQGGAPAVVGLLGGQVQMSLLSYSLVSQHIEQGKLRALAIVGEKPSARFAGVPLMKDQGLGDSPQAWVGMFAPAGTPQSVIARMNKEVKAALAEPEIIKKADAQGLLLVGSTPEELGALVKSDFANWAEVVKAADVRLD